jgi:hypothetical protein
VSACDLRAATLRFFRAFSSVVRQIPGYNSQRRGTARTSQISSFFLLCMFNFLIVMYVPFSIFRVLFMCKCVLYYCHRVSTELQLNTYIISYRIISYHILSGQVRQNPNHDTAVLHTILYYRFTLFTYYIKFSHISRM